MFKVFGIIEISKIVFFNFSSTERIKQNQINLESFQKQLPRKPFIDDEWKECYILQKVFGCIDHYQLLNEYVLNIFLQQP